MKRILLVLQFAVAVAVLAVILWIGVRVHASSATSRGGFRSSWSPAAAASYLDYRAAWWEGWPAAQRSQGTVCVSCHTTLPYALVRPALRQQLNEASLTPAEQAMLESIEKRVGAWPRVDSYYSDPAHAEPSRSTEVVLNAVILAAYSANQNRTLPQTERAFDEAWSRQKTDRADAGGWDWQNFHEAPWESTESAYQGAAFMAMAVGMMPTQYAGEPTVRNHVQLLEAYLSKSYPTQPLMNQIYVLWASASIPGLISEAQRTALLTEVARLQHSDGGWSLADLDPQRTLRRSMLDLFKRAESADGSDGCATGLTVLALETSGVRRSDPALQRGLAWLEGHQYQDGTWWASSLNGFRDPASEMGRFMSDAATGYAVLALERASSLQKMSPPPASEQPVHATPGGPGRASRRTPGKLSD